MAITSSKPESVPKRPNILFILADDLGFSDIECYGSEIQTPNIDRMASEGIRMLNHHAAAACSPTRAMLLSSIAAHLGGLGVLIEYKNNEKGAKRWSGKAGYEEYLNDEVAAIPEILQNNGYFTLMSGKWHLGMRASQGPWNRGFEKAFAMLPGCSNHYGWEPVQERFPVGGRPIHAEEGVKVDMPPNKTEDPEGFYSTDFYTNRLLDYFQGRTEEDKEKPFFAFLPYAAPHWPLQCSKEQRDKYKGVYDDGPLALRERRLHKLADLGIIDKDVIPHKVETSTMGVGEWDELNPKKKKLSSRAMETYAGMVDSIDVNVGRVVEYLKRTGEYDNTFVVFMSDNGAEGAALEAVPVMGENIKQAIHQYYDNPLENIGSWNSYTWLGPLWAQASTATSRLFKCYPSQGGILIIHDSDGFRSNLFEMAGVKMPPGTTKKIAASPRKDAVTRQMNTFRRRDVHTIRGKSWLPYFARGQKVEEDDIESGPTFGWELFARGALRKGGWKIVHFPKDHGGAVIGGEGWELFNVVADPGETKDLDESEPEKLKELLAYWDEYVVECGIVCGRDCCGSGSDKG
ncbi:unnamed protein product [Clonostachys chloroleuca]|uniref:Sulfatase N-terminal domain-containing protein n=1 Tax=Clonostachys chloroleuca TaxID=1926264 RepID=A0AA35LRJ5_9HYPO|nr:unnamed protein product [Clonostachys chloroleuca]